MQTLFFIVFLHFLFSPLQKDFVLEVVHVVEKKTSEISTPSIPNEIIDKMVFQFKDIIYVKAKDCDLEYAVKGGKD